MKLIITVGLPYSGKTTWAMAQGVPVVSPDAIRDALSVDHLSKSNAARGRLRSDDQAAVWGLARLMVDALACAGHDTVIVDATHVKSEYRDEWRRFAEEREIEFAMHVVDTAPELCKARAMAVHDSASVLAICGMAKGWDLPKPASWAR